MQELSHLGRFNCKNIYILFKLHQNFRIGLLEAQSVNQGTLPQTVHPFKG